MLSNKMSALKYPLYLLLLVFLMALFLMQSCSKRNNPTVIEGCTNSLAGNYNSNATKDDNSCDLTVPTVTIQLNTLSQSNLPIGSTIDERVVSINFTLSEDSIDFDDDDIVIINGILSDFAGSSSNYSASISSISEGMVTVNIATNSFSDINGNKNQSDTLFFWTYADTPIILPIPSSDLSWGPTLNSLEADIDGTISISTVGVEDGQTLSIVLNGISFSASVSNNTAIIAIPSDTLKGLSESSYSISADVSDAAGNPAVQVISDTFSVNFDPPTISSITYSWGSILNKAKSSSDGTVTITTSGVENGQLITLKLNQQTCYIKTICYGPGMMGSSGKLTRSYTFQTGIRSYSAAINDNSATITIPSLDLLSLSDAAYSFDVEVFNLAGNPASPFSSNWFSVDLTPPSILPISSEHFSWGATLNVSESNVDGAISISTSTQQNLGESSYSIGVEDGQTLSIVLNGISFSASVSNNTAIIAIPSDILKELSESSYSISADVSDAAGNPAIQVISDTFEVD